MRIKAYLLAVFILSPYCYICGMEEEVIPASTSPSPPEKRVKYSQDIEEVADDVLVESVLPQQLDLYKKNSIFGIRDAVTYLLDLKRDNPRLNSLLTNDEIKKILVRANFDLSVVDTYEDPGWKIPALHIAAEVGDLQMALALLIAGANVNKTVEQTDNDWWRGKSPLHAAIFNQNAIMAKLLLDFGADPSIEDVHFETPKDFAGKAFWWSDVDFLYPNDAFYKKICVEAQKQATLSGESPQS